MSNKKYGLAYERKEKQHWESMGYYCHRSRGSFGLFDMIVVDKYRWVLVSVKSTRDKTKKYTGHLKEIRDFDNAPSGTHKKLIVYRKSKRVEYSCGTI